MMLITILDGNTGTLLIMGGVPINDYRNGGMNYYKEKDTNVYGQVIINGKLAM